MLSRHRVQRRGRGAHVAVASPLLKPRRHAHQLRVREGELPRVPREVGVVLDREHSRAVLGAEQRAQHPQVEGVDVDRDVVDLQRHVISAEEAHDAAARHLGSVQVGLAAVRL